MHSEKECIVQKVLGGVGWPGKKGRGARVAEQGHYP